MTHFPRIAIGSVQENADHRPVAWGVMSLLTQGGLDVQPFLARSYLPNSIASLATGHDQRHLDSWQMGPQICNDLMSMCAGHCDLAVVEGEYRNHTRATGTTGGDLDRLCEWLSIPRILVLDVSRMNCCNALDTRGYAGVILDRVQDAHEAARWSLNLEVRGGAKVLGWLPYSAPMRSVMQGLAAGAAPTPRMCRSMADSMARRLRVDQLLGLAQSTPPLATGEGKLEPCRDEVNVALAYDEAFHHYFPDMLDQMEAIGARIRTFSPLRQESLPPDTDIVFLGGGRIASHAERLAKNRCLHESLHQFKRAGGRIYAEGDGGAFLCRNLVLPSGRRFAMSGLVPATAERKLIKQPMQPVERCWPFPEPNDYELTVRGYRNLGWVFRSDDDRFGANLRDLDSVREAGVVATRVHMNLASNPNLIRRFLYPKGSKVTSNLA